MNPNINPNMNLNSNMLPSIISSIASKAVYILMAVLVMFVVITPQVQAQEDCKNQDSITVASILTPGAFQPIIPDRCAQDGNGPRALSLSVLPDILINLFGALCSLVFYLLMLVVVFSGIQYMYGSIDGKSSLQAMRNLQDAVIGIVTLIGAYVIINTILIVLQVDSTVQSSNIADFFTPIP